MVSPPLLIPAGGCHSLVRLLQCFEVPAAPSPPGKQPASPPACSPCGPACTRTSSFSGIFSLLKPEPKPDLTVSNSCLVGRCPAHPCSQKCCLLSGLPCGNCPSQGSLFLWQLSTAIFPFFLFLLDFPIPVCHNTLWKSCSLLHTPEGWQGARGAPRCRLPTDAAAREAMGSEGIRSWKMGAGGRQMRAPLPWQWGAWEGAAGTGVSSSPGPALPHLAPT